jgi:hypothetical protein
MPLQNRVTPFSIIERSDARGAFTGNRGILHNENKELVCTTWRHKAWIICELEFRGWKREVMTGRSWTELFFLDEYTALAAGHRPCAFCRPEAYKKFRDAWHAATGIKPTAPQMDHQLHIERTARIKGQTFPAILGDLPNGTMVEFPNQLGTAWLIQNQILKQWTHQGYTQQIPLDPNQKVNQITPPSTVQLMNLTDLLQ